MAGGVFWINDELRSCGKDWPGKWQGVGSGSDRDPQNAQQHKDQDTR